MNEPDDFLRGFIVWVKNGWRPDMTFDDWSYDKDLDWYNKEMSFKKLSRVPGYPILILRVLRYVPERTWPGIEGGEKGEEVVV